FQYKDHLGNIRLSYQDADLNGSIDPTTEIIEEKNYYPFGLLQKGYNNVVNGTAHPYGYNGKEEQEELGLDWHDYGARMYDAALGRWHSTDNKAEFYFANSPYVYALNTPIQAMDPDGNLVIFINGLGGGGQNYWRTYDKVRIGVTLNRMGNEVPVYRNELRSAFDLNVSDHLGDHNRMYIDGSPGSILNNFTSGQRFSQGYDEGLAQAASIIGSLARDPQGNITETIKIITHSMGGVYGKGFVSALKYYIKTSKDPQVRKALITLVGDFDPFQAGGKLGEADGNTYTQQFINSGWWDIFNAGWLANEEEEGADEVIRNENKTSHFVDTFIGNIDQLQEGTYEWNDDKQEWICTSCKND
ncbi:RHS repeat-associated core domain-containing protein, partial [Aequorivita sp. KMM 9714]|uniref:RHS repeat-associated core domain-containing protein n=1 Tax=Aequorivita sp. KMM 9714 TaxID=2707173 RepID=UPI0013EBCF93